jgi:hypothetical protein
MPSLLEIALASVKLSSGTLKLMFISKMLLSVTLSGAKGLGIVKRLEAGDKVLKKFILRYKTMIQPATICNRFYIKLISLIINRPLSGTDAVPEPHSSKT